MPAFRTGHPRTRVFQTVNTTLTAGNHEPFDFDGVDYDDTGQYDGAGVITIQRSGLYYIAIGVGRGSGGGTTSAIARALRSGATVVEARTLAQNSATRMSAGDMRELTEGDEITALFNLNGSASATLVADQSYLTVVRVGPLRYTGN